MPFRYEFSGKVTLNLFLKLTAKKPEIGSVIYSVLIKENYEKCEGKNKTKK
jgi:hypothetical protein